MTTTLAAMSVPDVLRADPVEALASFGVLMAATVGIGLVLRHRLRLLRSLRAMVLVLVLASLVLALAAALLSARLMLLDGGQVRQFVVVLGAAAGFGVVLVAFASRPLADDVRRLGAAAEAVERGDLAARSDIDRRDELGHTARAFDAMAARLAQLQAERQRDDAERRLLLTSVSHDLRTPVTALGLAIESLVDGVAPDPARYLQSMRKDVAALSSLIDDLFLLLRRGATRPTCTCATTARASRPASAIGPSSPSRESTMPVAGPMAVPVWGWPSPEDSLWRAVGRSRSAPGPVGMSW